MFTIRKYLIELINFYAKEEFLDFWLYKSWSERKKWFIFREVQHYHEISYLRQALFETQQSRLRLVIIFCSIKHSASNED